MRWLDRALSQFRPTIHLLILSVSLGLTGRENQSHSQRHQLLMKWTIDKRDDSCSPCG